MTSHTHPHTPHHTPHPHMSRPRFKKWLRRGIFFSLGALLLGVAAAFLFYFSLRRDLPSVEQILHRQVAQSTKIYDRTGKILLYEISGGERRTVVPIEDIPKHLQEATIAVEDENFYTNPAFDWKGILRAVYVNLRTGSFSQGASTITQQLARNAFLTPEKSVIRKLKELILAVEINKHYTKEEILELYLNEIPYGPTAYGVEAATQTFFGKSVKDISLAESAILAALPKAPTYYSPWGSHRAQLLDRAQFVLKKMKELGYISETEYHAARQDQVTFISQGQLIKAPHFVMMVQDYLTQKYGEDLVRRGGLKVITTLDWELQDLAERVVRAGVDRNTALYGGSNAALVAQDPKTGQILSMVGSRDYFDTANDGNFNVATQGLRQPGSSLKPFVYLTAFEKGYAPQTVIFDTPTEFAARNPDCPVVPTYQQEENGDETGCFHPRNFDGTFRGPTSLREALAHSRNIPAVKLLYLAGVRDVIQKAYAFGLSTLTNPSEYGLSLVLGGGAVHLSDLVQAYAVLAQDGIKHPQTYVLEVRDGTGAVIEAYREESQEVAPAQAVRLVNDILTDVEARRGLFGGSTAFTTLPDRDVALKTGTSNDYRDAWAMGFTPSLVVGVWAGRNDNAPMHKFGSSIFAAVPIWHEFFSAAHKTRNFPVEAFAQPEPVAPSKPVLGGDYLTNNELHSILYYVNRSDPTGAQPTDPSEDPQFVNWEAGILTWASQNLPNFAQYNKNALVAGLIPKLGGMGFQIETPANGSLVQGSFLFLKATFSSPREASEIHIRLNGQLLETIPGPFPLQSPYPLLRTIPLGTGPQQNLLELEAVNGTELIAKTHTIFYR
ncbi:MAG: penicillin-binding protein [Candidatus Liptonbacteria bacterium]|nr:penicillin-binding protein [Candidatus Liptonbacteria bacterium]